MSDPLVERYFRWLVPQIRGNERNDSGQSYNDLARILFSKEFVSIVNYDENRMADGRQLRRDFCHARRLPINTLDWIESTAFLEVLVGLSRHLEFQAGGDAHGWAWQLICNLELHKFSDPLSPRKSKQAEEILETCIQRTYTPDGQGGFFPLAWPIEDQRAVELWYQMAAYVDEQHPEH